MNLGFPGPSYPNRAQIKPSMKVAGGINISFVQVEGMISILAGIAPGDMHLARGQVDHHRVDGFLAVQFLAFDGMVAD